MKRLIRNYIKRIINSFGWKLTKIYKNKSYTNQKPNIKLLKALDESNGILHMGGHRGMEAAVYDWLHKKTIWIEANPKIFYDLENNISIYVNQKAYNILLYETDNEEISFNISNNDGASSSIYEFGDKSFNDNLKMINSIKLKTKKIDSFFFQESLKPRDYDFWVMDIQGAELPVLKGAKKSLQDCKFIFVEVSDGDFYKKGTQWVELKNFLKTQEFENMWEPLSEHSDILFRKK
tara:strand:+ start:1720 stop:2424 length:705 start_codon:yes stop_codon:yes gene_type:complete